MECGMILVVTGRRDGHVGAVTRFFDEAGVPWVRLNVEDLATNAEIDVDPADGAGKLQLCDSGLAIDLREISAVWYRKPEAVSVQHFDLDPAALEYVEAEMTEVVLGLYGLLDRAYWINNPFRTRVAHRKLVQLRVAAEVGFSVPKSLVTNNAKRALEFAESVNGDVAIKSLGSISVAQDRADGIIQYGLFTRRVSVDELRRLEDKIGHMPTLFQEFIPKRAELRVTCVGNEIFVCSIEPRGDVTGDDYRFDTINLAHKPVEYPQLQSRMKAYMDKLGLKFGCFDFIVPDQGEPVFLECNCNGQWLWVEKLTGQQIGRSIANDLMALGRLAAGANHAGVAH